MTLLDAAKETDNKLRWDADVDGVRFSLYIPKWRVPEPWPERIRVTLYEGHVDPGTRSLLTRTLTTAEVLKLPIVCHLRSFREHTRTVRYRPVGDPCAWQIGEPYVPAPLTFGGAAKLTMTVEWLETGP